MHDDVRPLAEFYEGACGSVVRDLLRRRIGLVWPDLAGQTVLGLGYTAPFLSLWRGRARLCIDSGSGVGPAASRPDCILHDDELPFVDSSLDRVLMVHGLENAAQATRTLRAVWRALRDDGRLLIVVPNRTGLWAHLESTPFADGAPCSTGRMGRLLARSLFRIERLEGALYGPPISVSPLRRLAPMLEAAGRLVTPRLAGVLVVEAVKDVDSVIPAPALRSRLLRGRRILLPQNAAARADQARMTMPCSSSRSR